MNRIGQNVTIKTFRDRVNTMAGIFIESYKHNPNRYNSEFLQGNLKKIGAKESKVVQAGRTLTPNEQAAKLATKVRLRQLQGS